MSYFEHGKNNIEVTCEYKIIFHKKIESLQFNEE
jgi:hypothetical protein